LPRHPWLKDKLAEPKYLWSAAFAGCHTRTASGHATAALPSSVMNSRAVSLPCLPCFRPSG